MGLRVWESGTIITDAARRDGRTPKGMRRTEVRRCLTAVALPRLRTDNRRH
jgi:hypothetical protein